MNVAKYAGNMGWKDEALMDKWWHEQQTEDDEDEAEDPWWEADEYKGEQEEVGVWRP